MVHPLFEEPLKFITHECPELETAQQHRTQYWKWTGAFSQKVGTSKREEKIYLSVTNLSSSYTNSSSKKETADIDVHT